MAQLKKIVSLALMFVFLVKITQAIVLEKGNNVTVQMQAGIRKCVKDASMSCSTNDRGCFTQVIGTKIQNLYGRSWNVHLLEKATSMIKGKQYSHQRWITLVNQGEPAYSYYIFKPTDCNKLLFQRSIKSQNFFPHSFILYDDKQYWGSSVTEGLKSKIRQLVEEAYNNSQLIQNNAEYIQNKLGPGRWEIIIWNTPSFDYMNTCMYANYFGILVGIQRGTSIWSYYVGRMSLI